jgi:hypothetical protein
VKRQPHVRDALDVTADLHQRLEVPVQLVHVGHDAAKVLHPRRQPVSARTAIGRDRCPLASAAHGAYFTQRKQARPHTCTISVTSASRAAWNAASSITSGGVTEDARGSFMCRPDDDTRTVRLCPSRCCLAPTTDAADAEKAGMALYADMNRASPCRQRPRGIGAGRKQGPTLPR